MNDVTKICMIVGNHFNKSPFFTEDMKDWKGSEECGTVAKLVCEMVSVLNISPEKATDSVLAHVSKHNFRKVDEHAWDEYVRGFLAGQILGIPTEENRKIFEKAEELWDSGYGGYFAEALYKAKEEN